MSLAIDKSDEYRQRLGRAVEARNDGEPEESAEILEALLSDFPGDADTTIEYVRTLKTLGKRDVADRALARAMESNPDHFQLHRTWAEQPVQSVDHDESRLRGRALRHSFPPAEYPESWRTLAIELDGLHDTSHWDLLAEGVEEHWDDFLHHAEILPAGIKALNKLFRAKSLKTLVDAARPEAWRNLPEEAAANLRLRAEIAMQNEAMLRKTGVRVVSLGQNCLPYLLGGRWGLMALPADPAALTPFDLGGFRNDTVAEAIETDFASYADRSQYGLATAWGGGAMLLHKPSGTGFFHERGPYWVTPDRERFFARLDGMIAYWKSIKHAGRRLFVFCYCGAGSLERLIEAAGEHLLGPDSHLLVIDVLKDAHECPPHPGVTYCHIPYPDDYDWPNLSHQVSARGARFELNVANQIVATLARFVSRSDGRQFTAEQRATLRTAAQKARAAGQREYGVQLLTSLLAAFPFDVAAVLDCAAALRSQRRDHEADALLTRAVAQVPESYPVRKRWADMPFLSTDWDECFARGRALRTAFPPETHPQAWATLSTELTALLGSGRWGEIAGLIENHREGFASQPELLRDGLDMLARMSRHAEALALLDTATPAALAPMSAETVAGLRRQLGEAMANQQMLRDLGVRVLSLGRNALPFVLAGRWGLTSGPADYDALTPFEIAEFPLAATADAIRTDFAAYTDSSQYVEVPAWFSGTMLRHAESGVSFFGHRRARWNAEDRARFLAHMSRMLANWREASAKGPRVFLIFVSEDGDLDALVDAVQSHLPGSDAHLVIVDTRASPCAAPDRKRVAYVHAPSPERYDWTRFTACVEPSIGAYESKIIAAILGRVADMRRSPLDRFLIDPLRSVLKRRK